MQSFGLLALFGIGDVGQVLVDRRDNDPGGDGVNSDVFSRQLPHSYYLSLRSLRLSPTVYRRFNRLLPMKPAPHATKTFFIVIIVFSSFY